MIELTFSFNSYKVTSLSSSKATNITEGKSDSSQRHDIIQRESGGYYYTDSSAGKQVKTNSPFEHGNTPADVRTKTPKGKRDISKTKLEDGIKNNLGYDDKTPKKDIDWTDHGRKNHTNPHEHKYNPDTGKRN